MASTIEAVPMSALKSAAGATCRGEGPRCRRLWTFAAGAGHARELAPIAPDGVSAHRARGGRSFWGLGGWAQECPARPLLVGFRARWALVGFWLRCDFETGASNRT